MYTAKVQRALWKIAKEEEKLEIIGKPSDADLGELFEAMGQEEQKKLPPAGKKAVKQGENEERGKRTDTKTGETKKEDTWEGILRRANPINNPWEVHAFGVGAGILPTKYFAKPLFKHFQNVGRMRDANELQQALDDAMKPSGLSPKGVPLLGRSGRNALLKEQKISKDALLQAHAIINGTGTPVPPGTPILETKLPGGLTVIQRYEPEKQPTQRTGRQQRRQKNGKTKNPPPPPPTMKRTTANVVPTEVRLPNWWTTAKTNMGAATKALGITLGIPYAVNQAAYAFLPKYEEAVTSWQTSRRKNRAERARTLHGDALPENAADLFTADPRKKSK